MHFYLPVIPRSFYTKIWNITIIKPETGAGSRKNCIMMFIDIYFSLAMKNMTWRMYFELIELNNTMNICSWIVRRAGVSRIHTDFGALNSVISKHFCCKRVWHSNYIFYVDIWLLVLDIDIMNIYFC